jgi:hypothetical protein
MKIMRSYFHLKYLFQYLGCICPNLPPLHEVSPRDWNWDYLMAVLCFNEKTSRLIILVNIRTETDDEDIYVASVDGDGWGPVGGSHEAVNINLLSAVPFSAVGTTVLVVKCIDGYDGKGIIKQIRSSLGGNGRYTEQLIQFLDYPNITKWVTSDYLFHDFFQGFQVILVHNDGSIQKGIVTLVLENCVQVVFGKCIIPTWYYYEEFGYRIFPVRIPLK